MVTPAPWASMGTILDTPFRVLEVKAMMPDQAEMVEQNIDQLLESGMMKMESTVTADYEFLPNGWLKSLRVVQKQENMGQSTEMNMKTELVEE